MVLMGLVFPAVTATGLATAAAGVSDASCGPRHVATHGAASRGACEPEDHMYLPAARAKGDEAGACRSTRFDGIVVGCGLPTVSASVRILPWLLTAA